MNSRDSVIYDEEGINYDDIPEITDFSKGRKNPFAGKFNGKFTAIVEHEGYNEVVEYDFTGSDEKAFFQNFSKLSALNKQKAMQYVSDLLHASNA